MTVTQQIEADMTPTSPPQGTLYIISAPSGAGKTSLVKALIDRDSQLVCSISYTTRTMRKGEIDGQDYHFVRPAVFEEMVAESAFLEHARVFDNCYGTARQSVEALLAQGLDVVLEIDWQGAQQIRQQMPGSVSVFILPPSAQALESRLRQRGQDSEEVIARRMRDAVNEMSHYAEYDYLIVNDQFERALADMQAIVAAGRCVGHRQQIRYAALIQDLLEKPKAVS
jgi:guanylate kinase